MVSLGIPKQVRTVLLFSGVALLGLSGLLLLGMLFGFTQLPDQFFAGESTVHTVARVAIVGCLLAAIATQE